MIKVNFKDKQVKITFVCDEDYLHIYTNNYVYKISKDCIFYGLDRNDKDLILIDQEQHKIIVYGSWINEYYGSFGHDITLNINDVILYRLRKTIKNCNIKIKIYRENLQT